MIPKFRLRSKEEIPEKYADDYKETTAPDGTKVWEFQLEGAVPQDKLAEFRDNNVELKKENDELKKQFDGIDPAAAKKAIKTVSALDDKTLVDAGKVDEMINSRTEEMRKKYETELAERDTRISAADATLSRLTIDNALIAEGTKLGLRPEATDDLVYRGRNTFVLEDGVPVAKGPDGKPLFNAQSDPLAIGDYVKNLADTAKHLFQDSSGGGTPPGGSDRGGGSGTNPWDPKTYNVTEQMRMVKADRSKAEQLASKYGKKLPEPAR